MSSFRGEYQAWLRSLSDDELRDYRFELHDRAEIADATSDTYAFAEAALKAVCAQEHLRDFRRRLVFLCMEIVPEVDPEVFTDAFFALARAERQLGSNPDVGEVFAGALEVAERRAGSRRSEQNSTEEEEG
jgi:mannose/cellobiose epimerase-like protein (N-acyl-D-glucosamine 2-epimerase family)